MECIELRQQIKTKEEDRVTEGAWQQWGGKSGAREEEQELRGDHGEWSVGRSLEEVLWAMVGWELGA